jgi:phosphohistidine phosphatase
MELILWRHAEAEDGEPDHKRELTAHGRKQAAKTAEWLEARLPADCEILVSPTARTMQTAHALGRKFKVEPELAPGADAERLLELAEWPGNRKPVLLVGHQPVLGEVAALLIAGVPQPWTIKKSAVWWIVQKEPGDDASNYLKAVIAPGLL